MYSCSIIMSQAPRWCLTWFSYQNKVFPKYRRSLLFGDRETRNFGGISRTVSPRGWGSSLIIGPQYQTEISHFRIFWRWLPNQQISRTFCMFPTENLNLLSNEIKTYVLYVFLQKMLSLTILVKQSYSYIFWFPMSVYGFLSKNRLFSKQTTKKAHKFLLRPFDKFIFGKKAPNKLF